MIITSWLDNDAYNLRQSYFFWRYHREAWGEYVYKCRSRGVDLSILREALEKELADLCSLNFSPNDKQILEHFFSTESKDYTKDLCDKRVSILSQKDITIQVTRVGELILRYKGPIWKRILVETPLLATISELHFRMLLKDKHEEAETKGYEWIQAQPDFLRKEAPAGFTFVEGGTRRRFSKAHYERCIRVLSQQASPYLAGTSNILYGYKYNVPVVGTMAHQLQMYYQAIVPLQDSVRESLLDWHNVFHGKFPTALTDTLGDEHWDRVFRGDLLQWFTTERHDSGDPFAWGENRLNSYRKQGVDYSKRAFLFSDSLDWTKAINLYKHFSGEISVKTMIGTYITNTIPYGNLKPLSQVIKLMWAAPSIERHLRPLVKLSADIDKSQCECPTFAEYAKVVAKGAMR